MLLGAGRASRWEPALGSCNVTWHRWRVLPPPPRAAPAPVDGAPLHPSAIELRDLPAAGTDPHAAELLPPGSLPVAEPAPPGPPPAARPAPPAAEPAPPGSSPAAEPAPPWQLMHARPADITHHTVHNDTVNPFTLVHFTSGPEDQQCS